MLKTLNKNVYKIIQTNWRTITKTISYMAVWSAFNWNLNTAV